MTARAASGPTARPFLPSLHNSSGAQHGRREPLIGTNITQVRLDQTEWAVARLQVK